ncbi:MAG: tautomerase family protein [Gemmatimonadota bacterium]
MRKAMPHVSVKLRPGKSEQQKARLVAPARAEVMPRDTTR